jgi:segregation and condensation protein B
MTQPPERAEEALLAGVESILLVAGGPVSFNALAAALRIPVPQVSGLTPALRTRLSGGIRLQVRGESFQLVTAPGQAEVVHRFLGTAKPPALTRAAMETLAVIAYQQPVTRAEIEHARGVNSDRLVQTLLARGLIEEVGRRDTLGRPSQYGTTAGFLEYFGLSSLEELPPLETEQERVIPPSQLGLREPADAPK